ncbi:unnamed protein product [Meganyctiphanes norvegica]|uniref:Uncharacterized protein n=1 Tax=Meganyctiphanes norvegica TaxID=48144 RepID=A0AAV2RGD6_MEGNR
MKSRNSSSTFLTDVSIPHKEVVHRKELAFLQLEEQAIMDLMNEYKEALLKLKIEELTLKTQSAIIKDEELVTKGTIPLSPFKETTTEDVVNQKIITELENSQRLFHKSSQADQQKNEVTSCGKKSNTYLPQGPSLVTQPNSLSQDIDIQLNQHPVTSVTLNSSQEIVSHMPSNMIYHSFLNFDDITVSDLEIEPITSDNFNLTQTPESFTTANINEINQSVLKLDVNPPQLFYIPKSLTQKVEGEVEIIEEIKFDHFNLTQNPESFTSANINEINYNVLNLNVNPPYIPKSLTQTDADEVETIEVISDESDYSDEEINVF